MSEIYHVSFPGLGIDSLTIKRIAFSLFGIPVYWYGILISMAVIVSLVLAYRNAAKFGINPDFVLDTFMAIVPCMIIFARLYYVAFSFDDFKGDIVSVFNLRTGGLAFYGGVIGGVVAIVGMCRFKKVSLSRMMDLLAVYLPLAQGIGRWGNFFNQEAFGTNTTLPWGMISEGTKDYLSSIGGFNPDMPVHPTFLYEFIANMAIFAILIQIRKNSKRPFETTVYYFIMYGIVRFFTESIRTDSLYVGNTNLRVSMLLSAAMFLIAILLLAFIKTRAIVPGKAGIVSVDSIMPEVIDEDSSEKNSKKNSKISNK